MSDESDKQRARLRSVTPSKHKTPNKVTIASPALAVVNYQAMGEQVANMFFGVGVLALGPDWAPDVEAGEPQAVAGAFRDYFKSKDIRDIPPGFALTFVLVAYTLGRAQKPSVRTKFQKVGLWLKDKSSAVKNLMPTIATRR